MFTLRITVSNEIKERNKNSGTSIAYFGKNDSYTGEFFSVTLRQHVFSKKSVFSLFKKAFGLPSPSTIILQLLLSVDSCLISK